MIEGQGEQQPKDPVAQALFWIGQIQQEGLTPGTNTAITTRAYWGMIEDIARAQRRGEDA